MIIISLNTFTITIHNEQQNRPSSNSPSFHSIECIDQGWGVTCSTSTEFILPANEATYTGRYPMTGSCPQNEENWPNWRTFHIHGENLDLISSVWLNQPLLSVNSDQASTNSNTGNDQFELIDSNTIQIHIGYSFPSGIPPGDNVISGQGWSWGPSKIIMGSNTGIIEIPIHF